MPRLLPPERENVGFCRSGSHPGISKIGRLCPNVPECARMCHECAPECAFFLKHKRGATPWWAPRGDTCGWSFFLIYDFNRSPWRRLSTPRRPGRPLQSPIGIMVAIHGCSKVLKARAILCPCLLPRGPWYACAEPFPSPNNRSLVQEHVCTIVGLLVCAITPEEF